MRPTLSVVGGTLLLVIAGFMTLGFALSEQDHGTGPTIIAIAIAVVLPAATGLALIVRHLRGGGHIDARREALRFQTYESEVVRLAGERGGRLTLVEIVAELAIGSDAAQQTIDELVRREIADIAITDSGVLVYTFRDRLRQSEKMRAKGMLDQ